MDIQQEDSVQISAKNGIGIDKLTNLIREKIFVDYVQCKMLIPYDKGDITSYLRANANVKLVKYENEGTLLNLECSKIDYEKLEEFVVQ